jgi:hypothetical protein
MLARFRSADPSWPLPTFNRSIIRYARTAAIWPQPDGCLTDDENQLQLAVEFKPPTETKRGILTGLAQVVAYLGDHSAAVLVVPERLDEDPSFDVPGFIADVMARSLPGIPVALASYSPDDINSGQLPLMLRRAIPDGLELERTVRRGTSSTFWVNWRDTSPSVLYALLHIADKLGLDESGNPTDLTLAVIWEEFWQTRYDVDGASRTLEPVPGKVYQFPSRAVGDQPTVPFGKVKEILRAKYRNGEITERQALAELRSKAATRGSDNVFSDLKKNHYNFLNQLGAWDSSGRLTRVGRDLLHIGKIHGWYAQRFRDALAKLLLEEGSHLELIIDFESINEAYARGDTDDFSGAAELAAAVQESLEERGLVKRNPNRRSSGAKQAFRDEMTLWRHLELLKTQEDGTFFFPGRGLIFDWARITSLLASDFTQ